MTWIDLHLADGIARPMQVDAVETELAAVSDAFAAGWAAVRALVPTGTLASLFAGAGGLPGDLVSDLADAARMSGVEPPDLLRWFAVECPAEVVDTVLPVLAQLPLFDWVSPRPVAVPAALRDGVVSWGTNPKAVQNPAVHRSPIGVDAFHAWRVEGGTGLGVKVADVEGGWWLGHEDLLTARISESSVFGVASASDVAHGTSVAGILVGADNGVGVVGLAPDAELHLVTDQRADGTSNVAAAVLAAATAVGAGGVVLIELALALTPENHPDVLVEANRAVHEAIRLATILGVTVVEAAGNGAVDLDNPPLKPTGPAHQPPIDLLLPSRSDSGAVVVGAGSPTVVPDSWKPSDFSTRGKRVDCFAHGSGVIAPTSPGSSDTRSFGGTSAASAVVAGLVAAVQGMALAAEGRTLAPLDIRNLLRDPELGTPPAPGQTGVGSMPDLRRIARSQGWARVLPVAACPVADDSALLVHLDDANHVVRRHFSFFTGWGRPLAVVDQGDLWPAQPTALSWAEPDRLAHQVIANGPHGVYRAWWDSDLGGEPFTPLPTESGSSIAHGTTVGAAHAGADDLVLVGVDREARLVALTTGLLYPGLGGPVVLGDPAQFRLTTGPVAVSAAAGSVEAFAVADHGVLVWCHGEKPFETGWSPAVDDPTHTELVPGARLAAIACDGRVLVAAVGAQGWLHAIDVDPSQGAAPAAFSPPVVVDTAATMATQGPLALARLTSAATDNVLVLGVDTEGGVRVAARPAAGGEWAPVTTIAARERISPLGGVVAITSPDLGVMAFAVGVDGRIMVAQARSPFDWGSFEPLPAGQPAPPPAPPQPPPDPPPDPAALLISESFRGDPVLEAVAADQDRISRTRNTPGEAVGAIQHALLLWDPGALPVHGVDMRYGDETAGAVRRFKATVLGVPPAHVIDDVGPATVLRLDRIQAESEGLVGTRTTVRFRDEYGGVLVGLDVTVTTPESIEPVTTDPDGLATVHLTGRGRVELDPGSALTSVGNLLAREWPPAGGFPEGPVLTPAAPTAVTVQPGDALDVVVATRVNLTAQLVAPVAGTVRVEGRGVAMSSTPDRVTLALQATGGRTATVLLDPSTPSGSLPQLPPLLGWTPVGTYTVRPGDTAESLALAFVGDPDGYAELSDHPPVPGEQLTLPTTPGWLRLATDPVSVPGPVPWFTVTPDQIVAAILAGGDTRPLENVKAVLDRPPAPGRDVVSTLSFRAEALGAILAGPPVGPDHEVEESV